MIYLNFPLIRTITAIILILMLVLNVSGFYNPPLINTLIISYIALLCYNKKYYLCLFFILINLPANILLMGYDLTSDFQMNYGRFNAPQNIENAYKLSSIITVTSLSAFLCQSTTAKSVAHTSMEFEGHSSASVIVASALAVLLNLWVYKDVSILSSAYTGEKDSMFGINGLEAVYISLIIIAFLKACAMRSKNIVFIVLFCTLIIVFNALLSGSRVEVIGLSIGIFVCMKYHYNVAGWTFLIQIQRYFFYFLVALLVLSFIIGILRSELSSGGFSLDYLFMIYGSGNWFDYVKLVFGTWSDAAYVGQLVIFMVDVGQVKFLYGKAYLDILQSTVPTFVFDSRGIPLPTQIQNIYPTGGGVFLPSAFYWNGGMAAVVILGFMYGSLFRFLEARASGLFYIGFAAIISAGMLRGVIYSEQSLYKYALVFTVLYAVFNMHLFFRRRELGEQR